MRRLLPWIAAIALVAVVAIGLSQAGGENGGQAAKSPPFDLRASLRTLAKPPRPPAALGRLHRQANRLLGCLGPVLRWQHVERSGDVEVAT